MTQEGTWHLQLVKERHHYLELTDEQALKIYNYESGKSQYSLKHLMSDWEEADHEKSMYRRILDANRFEQYQLHTADHIATIERILTESDKNHEQDLAYTTAILQFYRGDFLKEIKNDREFFTIAYLNIETKIEFLKSEYKRFLIDRKNEALSQHFRFARSFKPRELELLQLRLQISYLHPDYGYFKQIADAPTLAVIEYVESKLADYIKETSSKLKNRMQPLYDLMTEKNRFYYGEPDLSDAFVFYFKERDVDLERFMSLLLLDDNNYGLDDILF